MTSPSSSTQVSSNRPAEGVVLSAEEQKLLEEMWPKFSAACQYRLNTWHRAEIAAWAKEHPSITSVLFSRLLDPAFNKSMENGAYNVFFCGQTVKSLPGAESIFSRAAAIEPKICFAGYDKFADTPWAMNVLQTAAGAYPVQFAKNDSPLDRFKLPLSGLSADQKDQISGALHKREALFDIIDNLTKQNPHRNIKGLQDDPSIQHSIDINQSTIRDDQLRHFADSAGSLRLPSRLDVVPLISRNLFARGIAVNDSTVMSETDSIINLRDTHRNTPLFYDRNVVSLSNGQQYLFMFKRFGTPGFLDEVKRQQDGTGSFAPFDAGTSRESSLLAKQETLQALEKAKPSLTFVFDGHGDSNNLILKLGIRDAEKPVKDKEKEIAISVEELATALKARYATQSESDRNKARTNPDILVIASCFSGDFARNLYAALGDIPKPIILTETEVGQFGYSDPRDSAGESFFSEALRQQLKAGHQPYSVLGDFFDENFTDTKEHSILVPGPSNIPLQISAIQKEQNRRA